MEDGGLTEPGVPADLRGVQPHAGLEPDPVAVDQAQEGHRHVQQPSRQRGDAIEGCIGRGVEHGVGVQGLQASFLSRAGHLDTSWSEHESYRRLTLRDVKTPEDVG